MTQAIKTFYMGTYGASVFTEFMATTPSVERTMGAKAGVKMLFLLRAAHPVFILAM